MDSSKDIRVVQNIIKALAPEVDKYNVQPHHPLGARWLVRSAAAQLQSACAWSERTHSWRGGRKKKRSIDKNPASINVSNE